MTNRYPTSGAPVMPGPVPRWDPPVTVALLLMLGLLTLLASFYGAFLAMASDACMGSQVCNFTMLNVALIVAIGGPWVVLLAAGVLAIVRMANNRRAFWVPLVAAPGVAIPFFVGAALAMAAT